MRIINSIYSDEILRVIDISDSIDLLKYITIIYFVRLSILDVFKKKDSSKNELDYKVIEKDKN